MPLIHLYGGIIMSAKIRNIQPRAVIDSVAVHFPLFSYYGRPKVTAGNGVRFWRYFDNWYTTFELSRYNSYGTYTPCLTKTPHSSQNNINPPFYKSVRSATNHIYHGYMDVILSHDKADFYQSLRSCDVTIKYIGIYYAVSRIWDTGFRSSAGVKYYISEYIDVCVCPLETSGAIFMATYKNDRRFWC